MKNVYLLLLATASFLTANAQSEWHADPMHSKLGFGITHLGISTVDGHFKNFSVTATTKAADFSDAVFELSAETTSIDTDVEPRDKHLRSADFFDVEKFPKMTFKSTAIKKTGTDKYQLTGLLTLHGVSKSVTLELWYRGTVVNPQSKATTAGIQVTGVIKRSDFNVGPGFAPPMLSDEVWIKADCELVKK
ncbi:MAG: YceI family protein [Flavobacterium sp.]|nr:YceI family protein [Flavobacterium sp.]